jgi:hypothetical protein
MKQRILIKGGAPDVPANGLVLMDLTNDNGMLILNPNTGKEVDFPMTREEEEVYTAYVNEDYGQLSRGEVAWGRGLWKKVNAYMEKLYWHEVEQRKKRQIG